MTNDEARRNVEAPNPRVVDAPTASRFLPGLHPLVVRHSSFRRASSFRFNSSRTVESDL